MKRFAVGLLGLLLLVHPRPAGAEEAVEGGFLRLAPEADSVAFRFMQGQSADSVEYWSFGPRATFDVLRFLPEIAGHRPRLAVELTGSIVDKMGQKHEIAFNPLMIDWTYDHGGRFVPFFEGGEGALWTTVRYLSLGGKAQFSSQVGIGLHCFLERDLALTFGFRYRHISNAGLDSPNHGLNTHFFVVGLTHFPGRGEPPTPRETD